MDAVAVALVFEPLGWAAGLAVVAGAVLLVEAVALPAPLRHRAAGLFWVVLAVGVGGGLVLAWVWGTWAGAVTPLVQPLRETLPTATRVGLMVALPMLAASAVLVGAGLLVRLSAALSGAASVASAAGAVGRSALWWALAGLTAFWVPRGAVLTIGAGAIAWSLRAYRRTTSPVRRPVKALLLGARIAVIFLLLLWALRPALEYRRSEEVRRVVAFCVDTSSSMTRRDARAVPSTAAATSDPPRRIDAVRRVLAARRGDLADLAEQADLHLVTFSSSASPSETYLPGAGWTLFGLARADGSATALGDAAGQAHDLLLGQDRKVAAMVVISDGCNNTADVIEPTKFAALMGARGVPVHTVAVGSESITGSTRTLTVRELSVPDEVEAFNRLPIAAAVETIGLAGRRVKVTCTFGAEEIDSDLLDVTDARQSFGVRFVHVPLRAGFHRVKVAAEVVGGTRGELAGRPGQGKLVHVVDREMRVLYVEGRFRYEAKYIARALAAARRFTLDRRVLLNPLDADRPSQLSQRLDDWLAYHAIVFGSVSARQFTPKQLAIVRDLVGKYGKGFCMIGGADSFGRGGWADTPLADVLPVDLSASGRQVATEVRVVPTDAGLRSDVLRIGEGDTADVRADWARLDPLPGANRLAGLKPAATVLAATPAGLPLIVAQPYGKGRSMAIAFDTTWRWVLTKKDTADMQRRFWRQVALYLAAPKGTVWIVTDKTSYDLRRLRRRVETIGISAGVEDHRGRPLLDVPVRVKLIAPDGREAPVRLETAEKIRRGKLPPPPAPGLYTLRIAATVEDRELTAEHRFEVLRRDLEALEVLANHDLLRRMARSSGGEFVPLGRFEGLLDELRITARPEQREAVEHVQLAGELRWPVIAALIALLCAEWALRKRKGLV